MAKLRAVYYINQFYAGMGGEEMADTGLHILNEKKGPALGIEPMWKDEMEVVKVITSLIQMLNLKRYFQPLKKKLKRVIQMCL